ncbi:MAG TPA: hypothetical protein PKC21_04765 [Oligoflexia bacterium]|nr:hypothetical protein [Oligoflexia bacterium]HMR24649.1 hypothetical protein [Oligoflexia bacterium]
MRTIFHCILLIVVIGVSMNCTFALAKSPKCAKASFIKDTQTLENITITIRSIQKRHQQLINKEQADIIHYQSHWVLLGYADAVKELLFLLLNKQGLCPNTQHLKYDLPIVIDAILPKAFQFFVDNPGEHVVYNGFNCHNTSLMVQGMLDQLSYVGHDELTFYLNNYCSEIHPDDRNFLDIVVFYFADPYSEHSATVIHDNYIFEKPTVTSNYRFAEKHASLMNEARYFRCSFMPGLLHACSKTLFSIKQHVTRLNIYFRDMVLLKADLSIKEDNYHLMQQLSSQLQNIKPSNPECLKEKQLLLQRLNSLIALYTEMMSTGSYRGYRHMQKG